MSSFATFARLLLVNRPGAAWLMAFVTATASLFLTVPSRVWGPGETPAGPADARDYDNLALNIARGRGYSYCWSDPEWRAPYEQSGTQRKFALHLSLEGPCIPTARRAPGYPAALAAVYGVFGRSFVAGRGMGAIALAATGALGAFLAVRVAGVAAGGIFAFAFLRDDALPQFVIEYLSEPLAAFLAMAVLVAHAALLREPKVATALLAATVLALLVLVRQNFLTLWLVALLGAAFGAIRSPARRRTWLTYGATAFLLCVPWAVRNCLVLEAVMPFGTHGGDVLAGSYVETETGEPLIVGTWHREAAARLWAEKHGKRPGYTYRDAAREMRSGLAAERDFARAGQEAAAQWIRRHWDRVPEIVASRLRAHFRGYGAEMLAGLVFGFVALFFPETRPVAAVGLLIVAMTVAGVAATYEVAGGRFSAPVRPIAFVVGSIGLVESVSRLVRVLRPLPG